MGSKIKEHFWNTKPGTGKFAQRNTTDMKHKGTDDWAGLHLHGAWIGVLRHRILEVKHQGMEYENIVLTHIIHKGFISTKNYCKSTRKRDMAGKKKRMDKYLNNLHYVQMPNE